MAGWPSLECNRVVQLESDSDWNLAMRTLGFPATIRLKHDKGLKSEEIVAALRPSATYSAGELWLHNCTLRASWSPFSLTLPVSVAAAIIAENGFDLVFCKELEQKMMKRMFYHDQIASLNKETDGAMLAADKVHFFPKNWLKAVCEETYALMLKSSKIRDEHMIGVFWIKGRAHRSYHCHSNKHQFANWLRGKNECVVCYEDTSFGAENASPQQMCYTCAAVICTSCFLDLAMDSKKFTGTLCRLQCVVCRTEHFAELAMSCYYLQTQNKSVFEKFSNAKKRFVRKWTARYKPPTAAPKPVMPKASEQSRRPRRDACQKCGKSFWDKKAYKRAPKCKKCKKAAYCNAKCRKAHRKEHSETCGLI